MDTPETLAEGWDYYTDLPVGEILKRTRVHYGRSLRDVEAVLRIRAGQLEALEDGAYEKLPGRVYAIGFIRSYSEYLGLEPDKIVKLYKIQTGAGPQRPELNFPVAASESKVPNFYILASSFVGLLLIFFSFTFSDGSGSLLAGQQEEIPSVPESFKVVEPVVTAQDDLFADFDPMLETAAGEEEERPYPVILNAKENVWLEIRNKEGKVVYSGILKEGNEYLVPEEEGLLMSTGNAGGLDIIVEGDRISPIGKKGDVKRHILLDPAFLKNRME